MHLKLSTLQRIVKQAIDDERAVESLRTEVNRVLGPAIIAEGKAQQIAEAANDRIDVLERTGRASRLAFKPAIMLRFTKHSNPEVRKLAARTVPGKFLSTMVNDASDVVRATVARRLSLNAVSEMLKKYPHDDEVRTVYNEKRLAEAGIAKPKVVDEPFDMYGEERLGDAAKQDDGPELSETWYRERAIKFMQDYGGNIEDNWEELAAHRYASSLKATSGVEIDEAKLLKAIKDLIKEREDRALERSALKETLSWLRRQEERELLQESAMPLIDLDIDPVRALVEGSTTPTTFIDEANTLFNVKESTVPASIRKHRLGERNARVGNVPVTCTLPHDKGFRAIDERALDMYCEAWNNRQQHQGEPMKIEWCAHPDAPNKVSFSVVLR